MAGKVTFALFVAFLAFVNSASILDYLDWDDAKKLLDVPELRNDQPNRNCLCKGPACVCCVDFNITFIDLGGPGCVHMKYVSPDDGFSVKVSYGKNLLHTSHLKGANPDPICLEVFGKYAEVCAKFSDLAPTSDGLRGCLDLEPKILGGTTQFPIGCFKSNAVGMEMEDPKVVEETTEEEETEDDDSDTFDAEKFLMNLVLSAEHGVAFVSNLLAYTVNGNETTTSKPTTTTQESSQRRAAKNLKHPNLL